MGEKTAFGLTVLGGLLFLSYHPVGVGLGVVIVVVGGTLYPWTTLVPIMLSLPFHQHPLNLVSLDVSITEVAIGAGIGAALLHQSRTWLVWRSAAPRRAPLFRPTPPSHVWVNWCLAAILFATILSLLVTEYPKQSLREVRWLILEPVAVLYLVRLTLPASRTTALLWALIATGVMAAGIALVEMIADGELLRLTSRASAPYSSPNHLALFLGRTFAITVALLLFGPELPKRVPGGHSPAMTVWRWSTAALFISLGIMAMALFRSLSLGAWVGALSAAFVLIGLRSRRWLGVTVATTLMATLLAFQVLPPERTIGRFDAGSGTGLFRLQIWTSSINMLIDHPLLGIGLDNFLYLYQGRYMLPEAWEEPTISHPHNVILHLWLQLGLLGLGAGFTLGVWLVRESAALIHRAGRGPPAIAGAAALGTFVDLVVHGAVDNSYFLPDAAIVFWCMLGVILVARGGGTSES